MTSCYWSEFFICKRYRFFYPEILLWSNDTSDVSYKVGETISQFVTFDSDSVQRFATLAGDYSPLHHDEAFAKSTRFGGLIVSGTQYSALMMGMVATFLTERKAGLALQFEFQFRKAVLVGKTVCMEWRIVSVELSFCYVFNLT